MNEKLRSSSSFGFLDRAEVGKVYDIEVSGKILYRDLLCVPNEDDGCGGCCLTDAGIICSINKGDYVCGDGKFIQLDILEDL